MGPRRRRWRGVSIKAITACAVGVAVAVGTIGVREAYWLRLAWLPGGCSLRGGFASVGKPTRHAFPRPASAVARHAAKAEVVLEATDLYGSHDDMRTLFRIPRLVIKRGQKVAVVGTNGCGKSTLLAALAQKEALAGGDVRVKKGARVAFVEQDPGYDPEQRVADVVFALATSPPAAACRKYRAAMAGPAENECDMREALEAMERENAWTWEESAREVMSQAGLTEELQARRVGELSGGEERRVALATALVDLPATDLLILDEPTNHLSAEGCDWLQGVLQAEDRLSVILVTHDRYFLDEVCDEILEIDGLGAVFTHPGGWQTFLKRRSERFAQRASEVDAAKVQMKRAEAWLKRGPQGRGTKNKAQIAGIGEVRERASAVVSANDNAPELARKFAQKPGRGAPRMSVSKSNLGIVGLENATVRIPGRGDVFRGITYTFERGTKVGIVGPNGAGKSTFLRALANEITLDQGSRIVGDGVSIGYLAQDAAGFPDPSQHVMDLVAEMADQGMYVGSENSNDAQSMSRERRTASLLKSVNFPRDRWQTQVGMLSGGERRRLQLLKALSTKPTVLLLDEPTNDLDAVTVDALEDLLTQWSGTVVLVSHDRSLLDGVCDMYLVLQGGDEGMYTWTGSFAHLVEDQRSKAEAETIANAAATARANEPVARMKTPSRVDMKREQRKLRNVEKKIEDLEAELAKVAEAMQLESDNAERLMELYGRQQELEGQQTDLYEQWEALAENVEG